MSMPDLASGRVFLKRPGGKLVKRLRVSSLSSLMIHHPIIFAVRGRVSRRIKGSVSDKKELALQLIPSSTLLRFKEVQRLILGFVHNLWQSWELYIRKPRPASFLHMHSRLLSSCLILGEEMHNLSYYKCDWHSTSPERLSLSSLFMFQLLMQQTHTHHEDCQPAIFCLQKTFMVRAS